MAKESQVVTAPPTTRRRSAINGDDLRRMVRDTQGELRKVTWPTPEQTRNLTLVVISVCVAMGIFLFIIDTILSQLVSFVVGL